VTSDFEADLRAVSLRVTRPPPAVLAALRDPSAPGTGTVIAFVAHQTVHGAPRAFTCAGHVRCIRSAEATARSSTSQHVPQVFQ